MHMSVGVLFIVFLSGQPKSVLTSTPLPPPVIRHQGVELILWYSSENIGFEDSRYYVVTDGGNKNSPQSETLNALASLRLNHYMGRVKGFEKSLRASDCLYPPDTAFHFSKPKSLEAMIENSQLVFMGEVEAVTPGFFYDTPASLLTVKVKRVLKEKPSVVANDYYYFSYLNVRFNVGDVVVCNENRLFNFEAWLGMRFLVFMWPAIPAEEAVVFTSPHYVFAERPDGTIRVPEWLEDQDHLYNGKDMDGLINALSSQLAISGVSASKDP